MTTYCRKHIEGKKYVTSQQLDTDFRGAIPT